MENIKAQRELLKEIVGKLKEKEVQIKKITAESDSLIAWGRQSMIEEVLLMLYQMHDDMVDEALMETPAAKVEDSPLTTILAKPIGYMQDKMTRRAFTVLKIAGFRIVADIYGLGMPLMRVMRCGYRTKNEIVAGLEWAGLPDPDSTETLDPVDYGFKVVETERRRGQCQQWYKRVGEE